MIATTTNSNAYCKVARFSRGCLDWVALPYIWSSIMITEKRCTKCKMVKSIDNYYKCSANPDSLTRWCKACVSNYNKMYKHMPDACAKRKAYMKTYIQISQKYKDWRKKFQRANKHKINAYVKVYRAVKLGKLIKPKTCSNCTSQNRIEGHHEDYTKPLTVIWLCHDCHIRKHYN